MQCMMQCGDVLKAHKEAYLKTNKQALEYCLSSSGATAASVFIRKNSNGERCLYAANVGDATAVLW